MGMKLNDLKGAHNLSGCDIVLVRVDQQDGETRNTYSIEKKPSFFRRTVHLVKYYVSGSYRKSVKEMRRDVLRDLEKYEPVADACTHGSEGVKDEVRTRLLHLGSRGLKSRKFVEEVQSLAKFAEKEGTVVSASKRTGWIGKSSSLSAGEYQRYIRGEDWKMGPVKEMVNTDLKAGTGPRPNLLCGHAALDCMTSVLLSDGVLRPHVDENDPEIAPQGEVQETQQITEKQERVLTAMAFLKFLTIEPHDDTNKALFKWSGREDVGDADKAKFALTTIKSGSEVPLFHGVSKPKNTPLGHIPYLKILTPEKALQQHVVNLLNKFPYTEGKGLVFDKEKYQTTLQEAGTEAGGEEELTSKQQEWVADKLLEFLS